MTQQEAGAVADERAPERPTEDAGPEAMLSDAGASEASGAAGAGEESDIPRDAESTGEAAPDAGEAVPEAEGDGRGSEAEPDSPAAESASAGTAAEIAYPDWWTDGADAKSGAPAPAAPEGAAATPTAERRPSALDDATRERLAAALCGPLAEDAPEDVLARREDSVRVFEEAVAGAVDRALGQQAAERERLEDARQQAAAKVQTAWDQLWQTAPELGAFRGQAEEQDIMEIAELELVRRGFGDARGQVDPLKLGAITKAQMSEVIRATQGRARRLLLGRVPTRLEQPPEGAEVVSAETTGAAVARSSGFAERPSAQTPPGIGPRVSPEVQEAREFVEGLKIASPPV